MVERGKDSLPGFRRMYVSTCKRCGHIVEYPTCDINHSVSKTHEAKLHGFRVLKRKSRRTGKVYYGIRDVDREDMDSCMNCNNQRGHDCDEHWNESRCQPLSIQPTPYTICDMHGKEIKYDRDKGWVIIGPKRRWS